jgi:hypothetical protein
MKMCCSNGFFRKTGLKAWKEPDGSGGLGVLVLVPGLVRSPSLVSSAVDAALLSLQFEAQDNPRDRVDSGCSSARGDCVECKALVKSDSLRSFAGGVVLVKVLEGIRDTSGREVYCKSGGSSTSARISSSEEVKAVVVGRFMMARFSCMPCIPW